MRSKEFKINIGEKFYPFKGLKELISPDTPDVLGKSKPFLLERYGRGEVILTNQSDFAHKNDSPNSGGNLIISHQGKIQTISLPSQLVVFEVYMTPNSLLREQPPLWCKVKVGEVDFVGPNLGFTDELPLDEGIFFYFFGHRKSSGLKDLVLPSSIAFLKNVRLCFDLNVSSTLNPKQ